MRRLKLACGLQHSADALVSGSTGGGARIPPSPAVRPPSALLLPSWGVSEPVFAVETVAWVSTPFPFSVRQRAGRGKKKRRRKMGIVVFYFLRRLSPSRVGRKTRRSRAGLNRGGDTVEDSCTASLCRRCGHEKDRWKSTTRGSKPQRSERFANRTSAHIAGQTRRYRHRFIGRKVCFVCLISIRPSPTSGML